MAFTASHPNGFATFSFSLIKGANSVALPDTSTWRRRRRTAGRAQSQYDASAAVAFVLAP